MAFQEGIYTHPIIAIRNNSYYSSLDSLSIEEPLEIILKFTEAHKTQHKVLSITMRTPGNDKYLALGFLYNEGIIDQISDVRNIEFRINCQDDDSTQQTIVIELAEHLIQRIKNLDRHFYTNSSCGVCGKTSIDLLANNAKFILKKQEKVISYTNLSLLPMELKKAQIQFAQTGGIHACGLFDLNLKLIHFQEDVGRHNALDKLIGWSLENKFIPLQDSILILSGRASFELIHKAVSAGIPIVASVGAPSSLAVQTADSFGMTLIGFLNENRMNIYTHPYRIELPEQ